MNNKRIMIGYMLGMVVVFSAFFYFYNAQIFEADVTGKFTKYTVDVSLKAFLDNTALNPSIPQVNLISVVPTIKGILLLIICLLGIPLTIGYRLATNNEK